METLPGYILILKSEFDLLINTIESMSQKILLLEDRIKELEGRLAKDSKNSHKPPSTDGYKKKIKIKNSREKSGKKQGAQPGHVGKTLEQVPNPDRIINHTVVGKCECGQDLEQLPKKKTYRRQVFDLPEKLLEVTEHRIEVKECVCGKTHEAECEVKGNTQYGQHIKSLAVYLNQYQLLPFERIQELMEDCFEVNISDFVLGKSNQVCYENLEQPEANTKMALINSKVIHNDESGLRCNNKLHWVHVSSTDMLTHYSIQEKRGSEGIDAIGILPEFKGTSVHDRFSAYEKYECEHSYCNAHLLRELKYLYEEENKKWASEMAALLVQANELKKQENLDKFSIQNIEETYNLILKSGIKEEPFTIGLAQKGKRGRKAKPKSLRLFETFTNSRVEILKFIHNKDVPFDNNLAERDIRMVKLKQKISGCFRTKNGAEIFCRIRGYISTCRKQGVAVLYAIEKALMGQPVFLTQFTT